MTPRFRFPPPSTRYPLPPVSAKPALPPVTSKAASSRYALPPISARPAPVPAATPATAPVLQTIPLEEIEYDEEGRRILTAPIAAPARPTPTMIAPPPMPPSRMAEKGVSRPVKPMPLKPGERPRPTFRPPTIAPDDIPY